MLDDFTAISVAFSCSEDKQCRIDLPLKTFSRSALHELDFPYLDASASSKAVFPSKYAHKGLSNFTIKHVNIDRTCGKGHRKWS